MRYLLLGLVLCVTGCKMAPNAKIQAGVRDFQDSSDWEQTDQQTNVYGIEVDLAGKDGFGPEFGITHSEDTSHDDIYINRKVDDVTSTVNEVYFGLRKNVMLTDRWQFSASGGMSAMRVETAVDLSYAGTPTNSDRTYAPYISLGTSWYFTENLTLGVAYRRTFLNQEADIFIIDPELDCNMYLLTLGWSF